MEEGELVTVCKCLPVHEECIKRWMQTSRRNQCEVCTQGIEIRSEPSVFFSALSVASLIVTLMSWAGCAGSAVMGAPAAAYNFLGFTGFVSGCFFIQVTLGPEEPSHLCSQSFDACNCRISFPFRV